MLYNISKSNLICTSTKCFKRHHISLKCAACMQSDLLLLVVKKCTSVLQTLPICLILPCLLVKCNKYYSFHQNYRFCFSATMHKANNRNSFIVTDCRHTIQLSLRAGILSCDHRPPGCQDQPKASLQHKYTADPMNKSSPRPHHTPTGHCSVNSKSVRVANCLVVILLLCHMCHHVFCRQLQLLDWCILKWVRCWSVGRYEQSLLCG